MRGLLEFGLSVETAWYSMHVRGVCVRVCVRVCVCASVGVWYRHITGPLLYFTLTLHGRSRWTRMQPDLALPSWT